MTQAKPFLVDREAVNNAERCQLEYIASERVRYSKLDDLRTKLMPAPTQRGREPVAYKTAANMLGLHAQQQDEIEMRMKQLAHMFDDVMSGQWGSRWFPL